MGLRESIQLLKLMNTSFNGKMGHHSSHFENPSFPRLTDLIDKLSAVTIARKVFCPEEYFQYWSDFKNKKIDAIPSRVRRFLCWEPDIGTDRLFLTFLKNLNESLSASTLQGLVYARHFKWLSRDSQENELNLLRDIITSYKGRNRLLKKWQENINLILHVDSPEFIGKKLFSSNQSISVFCKDWGINEQTEFVVEAVTECAKLCFKQFADINEIDSASDYFVNEILGWKNFSLSAYKSIISQTILTNKFLKDEKFQDTVLEHIMEDDRLGDPRLPMNSQNWVGIEPNARVRILQLLSRADIVFFFEQVMTKYDDRHGRKEFWLQYISSLKQSRPLLNASDKIRLYSALRRQGKKMLHYGETKGQQSAFLLDFGSILVIEFNGVGACYIYEEVSRKRLFPDLYTEETYTDSKLKQPTLAAERIRHAGDWRWRLKYVLSQYGIRPS